MIQGGQNMATYVRKPKPIEAYQPVVSFTPKWAYHNNISEGKEDSQVITPLGIFRVKKGDYIIKGEKDGEFYMLPKNKFEEAFELIGVYKKRKLDSQEEIWDNMFNLIDKEVRK